MKTDKGMKTAFKKYKEGKKVEKETGKKQQQRRTLPAKVASMSSDLNYILDHKYYEALNAAERTDLVKNLEELKKIADSFIKKIKTTAVKNTNLPVTTKPKRIDIGTNKMKTAAGEKTMVAFKPKRIEIGVKKTKK